MFRPVFSTVFFVAVTTASLLLLGAGSVSASTLPRAPSATVTGGYTRSVRPGTLHLTWGPTVTLRHLHWKSWGSRTARGSGVLMACDETCEHVGRVSVYLHDTAWSADVHPHTFLKLSLGRFPHGCRHMRFGPAGGGVTEWICA